MITTRNRMEPSFNQRLGFEVALSNCVYLLICQKHMCHYPASSVMWQFIICSEINGPELWYSTWFYDDFVHHKRPYGCIWLWWVCNSIQIMNVYECNGTNIFMRWKMKCSIQWGEAELNGTFHLSPNENICSIAGMRKHSLFVLYNL